MKLKKHDVQKMVEDIFCEVEVEGYASTMLDEAKTRLVDEMMNVLSYNSYEKFKVLENFLKIVDGSFGCLSRYNESIVKDYNGDRYAYLSGHYQLLLDQLIKLNGGRQAVLDKIEHIKYEE